MQQCPEGELLARSAVVIAGHPERKPRGLSNRCQGEARRSNLHRGETPAAPARGRKAARFPPEQIEGRSEPPKGQA